MNDQAHPRFVPAAVRLLVKESPPLQQHLIDWQNYGEEGALRLVYNRDILGSDYEKTYRGLIEQHVNAEAAVLDQLEARQAREEASPPDEDPGNPFEHGGEG